MEQKHMLTNVFEAQVKKYCNLTLKFFPSLEILQKAVA